tara:strand:+ start:240 stop:455 length:216 start_codon:yes stop_codon:yes gene_type:complete
MFTYTLLGIAIIGVLGIISYFKNSDSTPTSDRYRDQNPIGHTQPDNIPTTAPGHHKLLTETIVHNIVHNQE